MELITILGFALVSAFLVLFLKEYKPEFAAILAALAGGALLLMLVRLLSPVLLELRALLEAAGVGTEYFLILLKALGICYLTQFAASLCKDFGQTSLAGKIEFAGRVSVVLISLPMMRALIDVAVKLID